MGAEAPFKRDGFERGDVVQYHGRAIVSVKKRVGSVGVVVGFEQDNRNVRVRWISAPLDSELVAGGVIGKVPEVLEKIGHIEVPDE